MHDEAIIRPMTEDDIPALAGIRPGFVSDTVLHVERLGSGIEGGWRLVERRLPVPFDKGSGYDFDANERARIRQRLLRGDGLHLVVEWRGRIVGVLDVTPEEWNSTAWVWNLMLDQAVRRRGLGRALFGRAVAWARRLGYRALVFETQTNNVPACKFYAAMGCRLDGLRETLYTNDDMARGEVALFWVYPLT
jgi:ribosomal protein S18 acetylase RimI-like enzyme